MRSSELWRSIATALGAWDCPVGHAVVGENYRSHMARCNRIRSTKASMGSIATGSVCAVGLDELVFDSADHGVRVALAFKDGNLHFADVRLFFPPEPGTVLITVAVTDINVGIEHLIPASSVGPAPVVPLPTVNAALYCVKREIAITWRRLSGSVTTQKPSAKLLRLSSGSAPLPAPSGKIGQVGTALSCATRIEPFTSAGKDATERSLPGSTKFANSQALS